ncbi:M48 family metalloprotease [Pelomonas sp. APW6]|uniref:M48 family metalloprotease n=1 Tax=Roseateles subflavus TaxID=3053353 RepID=A0ABT7LSX2_9BURK|nr:M48 family metalloprotease [Pelomonas sp. APW6]MDL5034586.1 M48 family metalloprotease [Pelomonas sp. APW6]
MKELVYPKERTLGLITLVLGVIVWLGLIVGTFGTALIGLLFAFLVYVFAQSALISYIKGNGVELTANQFPDLWDQFEDCCRRLDMPKLPRAYVLNGDGMLNAFATRFLGTQYVVLLSGTLEAMAQHEDGVRFYLGHELGHLRMKHLQGQVLRWPVLWLPLLGAAYSRAREYTCDLHGAACCKTPEGAARALAALAAGSQRWRDLNLPSYLKQLRETRGFWMSFHELCAAYPWHTKRVARVLPDAKVPSRNPLAYLLAVFVPYAGRLGAGFGLLMLVYIVGVLAAIALPAYQEYQLRSKAVTLLMDSAPARQALSTYYKDQETIPDSLEQLGISDTLPTGQRMSLNGENMTLSLPLGKGTLDLVPQVQKDGSLLWVCETSGELTLKKLPMNCEHGIP